MATNKFRFSFKITGLELEVEGSKEDVAAITTNFGNQLKNLAQPQVISGNNLPPTVDGEATVIGSLTNSNPSKRTKTNRKGKAASNNVKPDTTQAIELSIDTAKYGGPVSSWKTLQKALWIIYVVEQEKSIKELTVSQIVKTFEAYYRGAGIPRTTNISRDFTAKATGAEALVGELSTESPSKWYLKDVGRNFIQKLIKEQLNKNGTN